MSVTATLHSGHTFVDGEDLTYDSLNDAFDLGYATLDDPSLDELQSLARGSILTGQSTGTAALAAKTSGYILVGDGTDLDSVAVSGDATLSAAGAVTIAAGAVSSTKLADQAKAMSYALADPGAGGTISATTNGHVPIVTAAAEARALANPSFDGQMLCIFFKTKVGNCTITAASRINTAGNTGILMDTAGDFILLVGFSIGADKRWQVIVNDGCTLS